MRRALGLAVVLVMLFAATPAVAHGPATHTFDGPDPAMWLSDPEGDDGDSGIEQGDPVAAARGFVTMRGDAVRIRIRTTGLEPGHTYTMWIAYFNHSSLCFEGCNGADFPIAGGGVIWGDGAIADHNGRAVFAATLRTGDGAEHVGASPPPPFATDAFRASPDNEFHLVIRSHGPRIPGEVHEQLTTFGGGCDVEVGPRPGQPGDFPVPRAEGECGDVQLYVFR